MTIDDAPAPSLSWFDGASGTTPLALASLVVAALVLLGTLYVLRGGALCAPTATDVSAAQTPAVAKWDAARVPLPAGADARTSPGR